MILDLSYEVIIEMENRKETFHRLNALPGGGTETKLTAVKGDITEDHGVQAIVNAANTSPLGEAGWTARFIVPQAPDCFLSAGH